MSSAGEIVRSNFTSYIPPGESEFSIDNPNTVRDGVERVYCFEYLELLPEYVAESADAADMDDPETNKNEIMYRCKVAAKYSADFMKELKATTHKIPKLILDIPAQIKSINKWIEENKPVGMVGCPAFFDWTHPALNQYRLDGAKFRDWLELSAESFYSDREQFVAENYKGYLPVSKKKGPWNDWKVPSHIDFMIDARIRLTLMPNMKLVFGNPNWLVGMGFTEKAYGKRTRNNQFVIHNKDRVRTVTLVAENMFREGFILTGETKLEMQSSHTTSNISFDIESSSARDRDIRYIVSQINDQLEGFEEEIYGYDMGVSINADQRVEFVVPSNDDIDIRIMIPDRLAKVIGFPPGELITSKNTVSRVAVASGKVALNPHEGLTSSSILVLDTGPLAVTMCDSPSNTIRGRTDKLMAFLTANGSASCMIQHIRPTAIFPLKENTIKFRVDRNSDRSKVIGLCWPTGCFVHGVVTGIPIYRGREGGVSISMQG